jgi:DNA-binding transcriptional MerR regulator
MPEANAKPALTVARLARATGVSADTVRYYERVGLLRTRSRSAAGYRLYGDEHVGRLRFIQRAKVIGFALEEIRTLLHIHEARQSGEGMLPLVEKRLAQTEDRIAALARMRDSLRTLAQGCRKGAADADVFRLLLSDAAA